MARPLKERINMAEAIDNINDIWNKHDPIGVASMVDDEYCSPILDFVVQNEDNLEAVKNESASFYNKIVTQWMCLTCNEEEAESFGNDIKKWWNDSKENLIRDDY